MVVLRFQVKAMRMPSKRPGGKVSVRVTGSCQSLGKWDRSRAMRMGNDECFEVPSMPTDALEHTTNGAVVLLVTTIITTTDTALALRSRVRFERASREIQVRNLGRRYRASHRVRRICANYRYRLGPGKMQIRRRATKNKHKQQPKLGEVRGTTTEINDGEEHPEKTPMKHADAVPKKMSSSSYEPPKCIVASDGHFAHAKPFRCAGVAVPVFSSRSSKSLGCGEFLDLKLMADFCRESGFRILQLLPVTRECTGCGGTRIV